MLKKLARLILRDELSRLRQDATDAMNLANHQAARAQRYWDGLEMIENMSTPSGSHASRKMAALATKTKNTWEPLK